MKAIGWLSTGFRQAARRPALLAATWLVPLVPAFLVAGFATAGIGPALDESLFSSEILEGRALPVLQDLAETTGFRMSDVLGRGFVLLLPFVFIAQVLLASGTVEVLLERNESGGSSFLAGIGRHSWRFARSAIWMLTAFVLVSGTAVAVAGLFRNVADRAPDGTFALVGLAAAGGVGLALFAPLDLAYDLSRIAAARHGEGDTLRGFLRAVPFVIRRPGSFVPLYLGFLALTLLPVVLYLFVRSPWTPSSGAAILLLFLLQQALMLIRAYLKVAFWGAEIACYRDQGEPPFCRAPQPRRRRRFVERHEIEEESV